MFIVQLYEELGNTHPAEDHLSVADNVFGVRVGGHLKLKSSTVVVGAQGPEMGLLYSLNPLQL